MTVNELNEIVPITPETHKNIQLTFLSEAYKRVLSMQEDKTVGLYVHQAEYDKLPSGKSLSDKGKMIQNQILTTKNEIKQNAIVLAQIVNRIREIDPSIVDGLVTYEAEVEETPSGIIVPGADFAA